MLYLEPESEGKWKNLCIRWVKLLWSHIRTYEQRRKKVESFIDFPIRMSQNKHTHTQIGKRGKTRFLCFISNDIFLFPHVPINGWKCMHCCSIQFSWKFYSSCVGVLCNQTPPKHWTQSYFLIRAISLYFPYKILSSSFWNPMYQGVSIWKANLFPRKINFFSLALQR